MATLFSVMLCVKNANAQNEGPVTGSNLDVGSSNVIGNDVSYGNAIGLQNTINANCSLATGSYNTINGYSPCSAIFGTHNNLAGMDGFIVGSANTTEGDLAMAFGDNLTVMGLNSILFGNGYYNGIDTYKLENTINYSFMVGFNSTRPTFLVYGPRNVGDVNDMTGKIAIGDVSGEELSETDAKMIIRSDEGEDAGIILEPKDLENSNTFIQLRDENHGISVDNAGHMSISSMNGDDLSCLTLNGKVGVNIENTYEGLNYAFAVSGGILADKVFIQQVDQWHDAVFSTDYKLMSLNDLKLFVQANHHLPEVPAESEVLEQGYDMAEMQGILLKKIEELTLYTIEQQEIIEQLQQRVDELENRK